jgi:hypothetical protein
VGFIPAFTCSPNLNLYSRQNINDGFIRPYGLPHCWSSATIDPAEPAWIALDFDEPKQVGAVELVFDSNLNPTHCTMLSRALSTLCRDYNLYAIEDGKKKLLVEERDNCQRFRRHVVNSVTADRIELVVFRTWGDRHVTVHDLRIYSQSQHMEALP